VNRNHEGRFRKLKTPDGRIALAWRFECSLRTGIAFEILRREVPVDQVPKIPRIWAGIAVIDVVGVFPTSQVRMGVSRLSGDCRVAVLTTARVVLLLTSQAQPEQGRDRGLGDFSLNASNDPKALSMAWANSPEGLPPPFGLRQFQ
jgi:hypothetical protein